MQNIYEGTTYDGVFFFPGIDDDGDEVMAFSYWTYSGKYANKKSIESTDLGNKFFVAFFKEDDEGNFGVDDTFEAIFSDPPVYLNGLIGSNLFGVLCRKTENSEKWFKNYIKETKQKLKKLNEKNKGV